MRPIIQILMLIGIACIAACQSKSTKVQAFIEGSYVNHAQSAYAMADDTLTFSHTDGPHYNITRHTGYRAIRGGKLLPKKYKLEKLEGDYEPQTGLLNETTTGRIFRFDPNNGVLLLKQAVYHKIN